MINRKKQIQDRMVDLQQAIDLLDAVKGFRKSKIYKPLMEWSEKTVKKYEDGALYNSNVEKSANAVFELIGQIKGLKSVSRQIEIWERRGNRADKEFKKLDDQLGKNK